MAADTSPKVNLQLAVGAENDVVEVTTENPQLKTDRADVAAVFNQKTIQDLPISGRNFASLELLIPGAQAMGWSQNSAEDAQGSPTVNISGQSFSGVEYQLDGAANQDPILGQIVVNPPLDAVAEAKISTQAYDAEFGQSTAAVVSAQTKSGTNAFTGMRSCTGAALPTSPATPTASTLHSPPPPRGSSHRLSSVSSAAPSAVPSARTRSLSSATTRACASASAPLSTRRFLPP